MRIVVLISDTFRFDHVAAHGLKKIHTPNLDALAAAGILVLLAGLLLMNAGAVLMRHRSQRTR